MQISQAVRRDVRRAAVWLLTAAFALALVVILALAAPPLAVAAPAEHGRFHHVQLNVTDAARTEAFYGKVFGTVPTRYAGKAPALVAETSFLFLHQVAGPILSSQQTGLLHIGWAGVDGPAEYERLKALQVAFETPLTPFLRGHYMYLYGPDHEVIEIWTDEKHHRLNHVHLLAADPKTVAEWFARVTNSAQPPQEGFRQLGNWNLGYGNVTLHVLPDIPALRPKERQGPMQPTDGAGLGHLGFSFEDIDAEYRRVKALGEPIVRPMATDPATGLRGFFVRAPNGVLVQMVKARAWPDAAWE